LKNGIPLFQQAAQGEPVMPRAVQISDSEWDVMEPVWEAGACTAADVIKRLRATHDWNHSTIRTLLARLVEKGALDYQVDGSRFLEKVFGGDVGALLAHFVADASLDRDQLEQLQQVLAQQKTTREKRK
jgi:BlaI family penicillinase repressor